MPAQSMEQLVALCKRRGFIYPSSQIYGGMQGCYDFGPLGVELKRNLIQTWWEDMVYGDEHIEGIDSSILTHKQVLHHSGHEATFTDPLVDCKSCKARHRADHIGQTCPTCGGSNLTEPRPFHLMFKTHMGPVADDAALAYLRPETAQGIFTNFKNVVDSHSPKLPFGIAQIGKAFRNEITPRNFIFRVREFEQMELEFFVQPGKDEHWYNHWVEKRLHWWQSQGLAKEHLKLEVATEPAHYAKATTDILYAFPHGLEELEGIANRTDFDLGSHSKEQKQLNIQATVMTNEMSTAKLAMVDLETKQPFVPFVIEPSAGVERGVLALLNEAYHEETLESGQTRTVLKLKPHLAPIKVAIIPLAKNNPDIQTMSQKIFKQIKAKKLGKIVYENTGNIGKSYRRHDEIGTPVCITIDFETIEATEETASVTIRDRDTLSQKRIKINELLDYLSHHYF